MSKTIFSLLVLVVVLFTGCANTFFNSPKAMQPPRYTQYPASTAEPLRIIPVVIDKNFSTSDRRSIDDSIHAWNYVLNGYVVMKIESWNFNMEVDVLKSVIEREGLAIMLVDSNSPFIPDNEKKFQTLAWANRIGGTKIWLVRDRIEIEDVFPVMLHELGHILGAAHEADKKENIGYLMYPHYSRGTYNCVDERAMIKVAHFQKLIPFGLNYCY